jgi:hypothetical protein
MNNLIHSLIIVLLIIPIAAAQTPGFHLIFGNHDGSTVDVYLDDFIELKTWVATLSILMETTFRIRSLSFISPWVRITR